MNLLHLIFNAFEPEGNTTWLSRSFSRWRTKKRDMQNARYLERHSDSSKCFKVAGAGDICIGNSCSDSTGRVVGFSFGVEWGQYGFIGGVLGRDEAKRMAEFILKKCAEASENK